MRNFESTRTSDINTLEDERQRKISKEIMAVVITQTFDSKIDEGMAHGSTTGGDAFVFLQNTV